ncbi:sulfurtransferase complex subunit TusB [Pseudomonas entomophila]|uniref:sulfurtransferase complex subunit TusB n=1 Tax=Pseudomonas entomophila TaxID=312306 RepID=UPI0015E36BD3|nr:sulfurtransferase complex subunit TusB [Pseudomonas entomophila]MBA1189392.1 sulfurtransferase complex subunit TusB [Pseudomonas entomophila]
MSTTLHVIAHSPFGDERLSSCLRLLGAEDALLLCGEAVQALRSGTAPCTLLRDAGLQGRLFALAEDLDARDVVSELAQRLDYPGFVDLTLRHDKVNTWL